MDAGTFSQSPFAVLTFIVAPAVLTNASSLLAMSTINRMLRTRDRMHELFAESEKGVATGAAADRLICQVNRVEGQAAYLLRALRAIYVSLASFSAASLIILLGAVLGNWEQTLTLRLVSGAALVLGMTGVSGLVLGCWSLLQATRLSLLSIRDEAELIRQHQQAVRKKYENKKAEG